MKNIAIVILVLGIALSYSCKKNKKVQTTISGTLITNGTNDPIILSTELEKPRVVLLHQYGGGLGSGSSMDEIASTRVDGNSRFSFDIDLYKDDNYYLGYYDVDDSKYVNLDSWYNLDYFPITPGTDNTGVKVSVLAHSWIRPRFINTNPDPNNNDVFDTKNDNIGPNQYSVLLADINSVYQFMPLKGKVDSLAPWIHKTWSGQTQFGGANQLNHEVHAKLTRNGVTIDTIIPYNAPPFDTSIVEIRY